MFEELKKEDLQYASLLNDLFLQIIGLDKEIDNLLDENRMLINNNVVADIEYKEKRKCCGECKDIRYDKEDEYYYCSTNSESLLEGCVTSPELNACPWFEERGKE